MRKSKSKVAIDKTAVGRKVATDKPEQPNGLAETADQILERAVELGIKALPANERHSAQWVLNQKRENKKYQQERNDWDDAVEAQIEALDLDVILAYEHSGVRYECLAFDASNKLVLVRAGFPFETGEKIEPEEIDCRASVEWAARNEVLVDFGLDCSNGGETFGKWFRVIAAQMEDSGFSINQKLAGDLQRLSERMKVPVAFLVEDALETLLRSIDHVLIKHTRDDYVKAVRKNLPCAVTMRGSEGAL